MKAEWIEEFTRTAIARNSTLAKKLQLGLSKARVERVLSRGKVAGEISPIIALYSWKNGTDLASDPAVPNFDDWKVSRSFFPGKPYFFRPLEMSMASFDSFKAIAENYPKISEAIGRYFPLFWDGSTEHLAIDVKPSNRNRVLVVDHRSDQPIREAYNSFEEFVVDAIRANVENKPLKCFQTLAT